MKKQQGTWRLKMNVMLTPIRLLVEQVHYLERRILFSTQSLFIIYGFS